MKKIIIALMGLSLLSGTVVFAQDSSTDSMKKKSHKKKKKGTATDSMGAK